MDRLGRVSPSGICFCSHNSPNSRSEDSIASANSRRRLRFFVTSAGSAWAALVGCTPATTGATPLDCAVVVAGGSAIGTAGAAAGTTAGPAAPELSVDDGGVTETGADTTAICAAVTCWNVASNVGELCVGICGLVPPTRLAPGV